MPEEKAASLQLTTPLVEGVALHLRNRPSEVVRRSTVIALGHLTAPAVFSVAAAFHLARLGYDGLADIAAPLLVGFLFYAAPHLAWAVLCSVLKPSIRVQHAGFLLCSCALALICALSFTVHDPSGLPYQWFAYWPLALVLLVVLSLGWLLAKLLRADA